MGRRSIDDSLDQSVDYSGRKNKNENGFRIGYLNHKELDQKVKEYKIRKEKNLINIIPYAISNPKNPLLFDKQVNLEKDDVTYFVRYAIHRNLGVNNDSIICLKHTFGQACPVCEENYRLYNEGKLEEAKKLMKSDRALYWVEDLKSEDSNYMYFDQPTFYFEQSLLGQARAKGDDKAIPFAHPTRGYSVSFMGEETTIGKTKFLAANYFDFKERRSQPGNDCIDKTFDLSEYLIVLSYDEIKEIMYGTASESDTDDQEVGPDKSSSKDDTESVKKTDISKSSMTCPKGLVFGKDWDSGSECDKCESKTWDACRKAKKDS